MNSFMRQNARVSCAMSICITHPTHSQIARVTDLSEGGARIETDRPLPEGAKFRLDVDGFSAWATVVWAEEDRMGIRFELPLEPLHPFRRILNRQGMMMAVQPRVLAFGRRAA